MSSTQGHPPFFFRGGGVGRWGGKEKKPKKKRRPGTPASLLWGPETTRHEPKINMAEKLVVK